MMTPRHQSDTSHTQLSLTTSYDYPASYGSGTCLAHDEFLPPRCASIPSAGSSAAGATGAPLSAAPSWCRRKWCYVDVPRSCIVVAMEERDLMRRNRVTVSCRMHSPNVIRVACQICGVACRICEVSRRLHSPCRSVFNKDRNSGKQSESRSG